MKSHYNYIIVEDVLLQRENLIRLLSGRMDLRLVASFETAEDAFRYLCNPDNEPIDLLLLDIELPERNGLDFLSSIKNFPHKPRIIITSAYPQYAIPSFDYTSMVSHYVLKPIEADKLHKAVDKAILDLQNERAVQTLPPAVATQQQERLFDYFSVANREVKIYFDELLYCEGANVNVKLVTLNETYLTRGPLKDIEKKLPADNFARIHDSFIINLRFVRGYTKRFDALDLRHDEQEQKEVIRIGKKYRESFKELMTKAL